MIKMKKTKTIKCWWNIHSSCALLVGVYIGKPGGKLCICVLAKSEHMQTLWLNSFPLSFMSNRNSNICSPQTHMKTFIEVLLVILNIGNNQNVRQKLTDMKGSLGHSKWSYDRSWQGPSGWGPSEIWESRGTRSLGDFSQQMPKENSLSQIRHFFIPSPIPIPCCPVRPQRETLQRN